MVLAGSLGGDQSCSLFLLICIIKKYSTWCLVAQTIESRSRRRGGCIFLKGCPWGFFVVVIVRVEKWKLRYSHIDQGSPTTGPRAGRHLAAEPTKFQKGNLCRLMRFPSALRWASPAPWTLSLLFFLSSCMHAH